MVGDKGEIVPDHPPPTTFDLRRPGTGVRVLLFLLSIAASGLLFSVGFPPGAPDRLPILLIAVTLALGAAWRPEHTVAIFAFLFPCSGLLARFCGGTDPTTWPALLFGGLAAGWTFRFIYDFESVAQPSRSDRTLRALLLLWLLSTAVAVSRASTLWAVLRRLSGRVANGEGLMDAEAIRESLFSLSALAAGAAFYFLLRRSGTAARRRALASALFDHDRRASGRSSAPGPSAGGDPRLLEADAAVIRGRGRPQCARPHVRFRTAHRPVGCHALARGQP